MVARTRAGVRLSEWQVEWQGFTAISYPLPATCCREKIRFET